jgi:ATP-dependent Lhr-like helicase
VTSDSLTPLRTAIASGFKVTPTPNDRPRAQRVGRSRFDRWRRERPFAGSWMILPRVGTDPDPLDRDEDDRERARIVLDRFGIVFRRLLERELPGLRWGSLFRALRLLELGGEIVAGHFVTGIDGLQFATHETIRRLRSGIDDDRIWWINAVDPASPCSLGVPLDDWPLPRRIPGNHLVFHGRNLVVISQRRGAELTIRVEHDHPQLPTYLGFLDHLLGRQEQALKRIDLESINGEPATSSPYRPILSERLHVTRQPTVLRLSRSY